MLIWNRCQKRLPTGVSFDAERPSLFIFIFCRAVTQPTKVFVGKNSMQNCLTVISCPWKAPLTFHRKTFHTADHECCEPWIFAKRRQDTIPSLSALYKVCRTSLYYNTTIWYYWHGRTFLSVPFNKSLSDYTCSAPKNKLILEHCL